MVYCWGKAEETEEEERQKVMMPWWDKKVVCPVKRAWVAIAARVKACKHGRGIGVSTKVQAVGRAGDGILKLHDDVQTCGYEDVQVMWEIVRRSEAEGSNASEQPKRRLGGHQPALPDERPPVTPRSCINITTTIELEEVGGFEQRAAVAALPPSSSSSCCA